MLGLTCNACGNKFSEKRGLDNHLKICRKHREQIGQPLVGFPCWICGRELSRAADIPRHQRGPKCLKPSSDVATQIVLNKKRPLSLEHSESPSQRLRTISPKREHELNEHHSDVEVKSSEVDCASAPGEAAEEVQSSINASSQHSDDGRVFDDDLPSLVACDSPSVCDTGPTTVDTLASIHSDGTQSHANMSPTTGQGDSECLAISPQATLGADGDDEVQIPDVTPSVENCSNQDDVGLLTHAFDRTSIDVSTLVDSGEGRVDLKQKQRSSFAMSTVSGYSAISEFPTASMRSFLLNPSLRNLSVSFSSRLSIHSSNKSYRRASTVPSEMAAPMLDPIDEELRNSRGLGNRLIRYIPRPLAKISRRYLEDSLRDAVESGDHEKTADALASGVDIIDVNCRDEHGWSPLLKAAYRGYEEIVILLLQQTGIDVEFQDLRGSTALTLANMKGHTSIAERLAAFAATKGRQEKERLECARRRMIEESRSGSDDGICCEVSPPSQAKPSGRTSPVSPANLQPLWHACEQGDVTQLVRLIMNETVDANSLNQHGRTPLSVAASHGHQAAVEWLLNHAGVDSTIQDVNGATALTWAAKRGHIEVVQMLLDNDESPSRNDAVADAAMMLASRNGHKEIAEMILRR